MASNFLPAINEASDTYQGPYLSYFMFTNFTLLSLLDILFTISGIVNINLLMDTGKYSATLNNMKLVHWPLMGGLLHSVQREGTWAGPQPAQVPPRCTKGAYSS